MTIAEIFLCFLVYSFIGWLWEDLLSLVKEHRFVNRGFLIGPYCPIYGAGALAFLSVGNYIDNPVALFFIGGAIACILEYITSYTMEKLFKARWWDYSNWPLNINGRICLYGFIGFGVGSVAIKYLQPHVLELIRKLPYLNNWAILLAIIFALDIISTNQSFARFNRFLREYQNVLKKDRVVQFFERKGHRVFNTINERRRRIMTWQQRRILRAFPNFQTYYDRAFNELQKFYKNSKYQPTQKAHARKKGKKILK